MKKILLLLVLPFLFVAVMSSVTSEENNRKLYDLPKKVILKLSDIAKNNFSQAQLPKGEPPPLDGEDMAIEFPILSLIVDVGALSATAEWCGLEWYKANYIPSMQGLRATNLFTNRQMAYLGLLHGVSMGYMDGTFEGKTCPDKRRRELIKIL